MSLTKVHSAPPPPPPRLSKELDLHECPNAVTITIYYIIAIYADHG